MIILYVCDQIIPEDGSARLECGCTLTLRACIHDEHVSSLTVFHRRVGEAKVDEDNEKSHVTDLAGKVRELNKKLEDIRKEQQYQREREHDFRVLSDRTNSGAVYWSLLQLVVLIGTCIWQMRTLRVGASVHKCALADLLCAQTWFYKQKLI